MADTVNISQTGQINLAGALDALQLMVFSGEVLNSFNDTTKFSDKFLTREIANGKSAQFPAIGTIAAKYHVPGTALVGTPIAHNQKVITIDDLLIANVWVDDLDAAKNHYDVRSEYTKQLGAALGKTYDRNLARVLATTARSAAVITGQAGGAVINGGATVRTDGALISTALFGAATKLDQAFAPEEDRFAFLSPVSYYAAASTTSLINTQWGGAGSISKGTFESLAGITIVKTNNLPAGVVGATDADGSSVAAQYQGTFTNTAMLVGQRGAIGTVRLLGLSMQAEYLTLYQATNLVARYAVGHGGLRPSCAVEIAAV
jgi:hypothetical protein